MRKMLLAIGSSAAEDRLKNNRELASEYSFTNIATHKDSILSIAKKEKPDVILIKETLGGNADILNIIFTLRSEVPNARIIFMTSPKNPGDQLMNSLVSCGVYDILAASTFSITSIIEAVKKPKTFGDVSQYIISTDMQKFMKPQVEQENVSTAKDTFNNQTKFQPHKEIDRSEPQEFGYLKIDDGQRKTNQDYSPILTVNKGTAGKSFKPMMSKPDVSKIDEIILDDENDLLFDDEIIDDVVVEEKTVLVESKSEPKKETNIEKPIVENKPILKEEIKIEDLKIDVSRETIEEEVISTYTPPTGNNSFIKNNRQFDDVDLKPEKTNLNKIENEKVPEVKEEIEEIQFVKNNNPKKEVKVAKPEIKVEEVKSTEQKVNKEVVSKVLKDKEDSKKELELLQTKENKDEPVFVEKEIIKVSNGEKVSRVYSFVKYFEFSENHASLNTALALAQNNKVLFLMVNDKKRNVVEAFIDSVSETTWYNPYKENLTFKKISKFELINTLKDNSNYDYVLIDTFYDKEFEVVLDKVSTLVLHVAAQQKPLFDFIHRLDCRKDVAVMVNYKNELISAKTVMKEGQFTSVVKVPDTDIEDFNAINSKVPSMGRKNNAKTLKDYENLLNILREEK